MEFIECGFEVVQDDSVSEAFEYEGEFPEWVDAFGKRRREDSCNGADIHNDESHTQHHGNKQDSKAWGNFDQFYDAEFITLDNVVEKIDRCEDPPWVTEKISERVLH